MNKEIQHEGLDTSRFPELEAIAITALKELVKLEKRATPNYLVAEQIQDSITRILTPFDNLISFNTLDNRIGNILANLAHGLSVDEENLEIRVVKKVNAFQLETAPLTILNNETRISIRSKPKDGFQYRAQFFIVFKRGTATQKAQYEITYFIVEVEPDDDATVQPNANDEFDHDFEVM